MKAPQQIKQYFLDALESITTVWLGMWITFKTAFFERKVTLQYPSHDVLEGTRQDAALFPGSGLAPLFEPLMGANQDYKGPLSKKIAPRYRGFLTLDEPKCIACGQCSQICPIDVITVRGVKLEGRKGKAPESFQVDYSKCMFCGLCVEICPTAAIIFTRRFEGATFELRSLVKELIPPDMREARTGASGRMEGEERAQSGKG